MPGALGRSIDSAGDKCIEKVVHNTAQGSESGGDIFHVYIRHAIRILRHAIRTLHTGEKMKPTPEFSPKNPVDGSRASVSTEMQAAAGDSAQAPGAAADDGAPALRCAG